MRTIITGKTLNPGDAIVIYAPTANVGEEVRIVKKDSLAPYKIAVCVGGVEKISTPKRHGFFANPYRDHRKFVVKE